MLSNNYNHQKQKEEEEKLNNATRRLNLKPTLKPIKTNQD
jgi:hypothetical protein